MKGCFQIGCGAVIGFIILVFIIGAYSNNSPRNDSASQGSNSGDFTPAPKSTKHGWIAQAKLGTNIDFWDGTQNYCDAVHAAAQDIYDAQQQGRDVDTSAESNAPGRHDLRTGTRVEVVGHETSTCAGQPMSWTLIRVTDSDSDLNGETGYIMEGMLSKQ